MPKDRTLNLLGSIALASAIAILASLGGYWGEALGQTAGIPPTRLPAGATPGVSQPDVTPPPAGGYRPAAPEATMAAPGGPTAATSTRLAPAPELQLTATVVLTGSPSPSGAVTPRATATPPSPTGPQSLPVAVVAMGIAAVAGIAALSFWYIRRPGR